jgi:hypothetical protein
LAHSIRGSAGAGNGEWRSQVPTLSRRSNPNPIPDLIEHDDHVLAQVASDFYLSGTWSFNDLASMSTIMPLVRAMLLYRQLTPLRSAADATA